MSAGPVRTGPPVRTGVVVPPASHVRLRIPGWGDPVTLDQELTVALFAAGLETPEPDRVGWVAIGELTVDDEVSFLVGRTGLDRETAIEAVRRGVEHALEAAVAVRRGQPPAADEPPSPGGAE